jgi:predicted DNA-binding transcriptional regulator AlpA
MITKLTYNVRELAEAIGLQEGTVKRMCSTDPDKLPPMLKMPIKRRMWAIKDVEAWIESMRQDASSEPVP